MSTETVELNKMLRVLRKRKQDWKLRRDLPHMDYALLPGTEEGDCATAYRRDRVAALDKVIGLLVAGRITPDRIDLNFIK